MYQSVSSKNLSLKAVVILKVYQKMWNLQKCELSSWKFRMADSKAVPHNDRVQDLSRHLLNSKTHSRLT